MPSYKEELDAMFVPGAEFLFMKPRCHPDSSITAAYSKSQGAVIIACATCNFGVADLAVASKAQGVGLSNMITTVLPRVIEEKPKSRSRKPQLAVVPPPSTSTPTHVQDQRLSAKNNRKRKK